MQEVRKIAHNTAIQVLGKAISIAIALIGFGLMTRYLGQEGFGYFSMVYAFLMIFGILVDLGMQMTTTQLISDPAEDESQILSNALTIRLIISVIFLALASIIVIFFPYPNIVKLGVSLAAFGFIANNLLSTITSLFQKHLIIYKTVIAEVIGKIVQLILLVVMIYFDKGLLGIISAIVCDSVFAFLVAFYLATKQVKLRLSFQFDIWKKILKKAWPIALTIALNLIYFKGDIFIMSLISTPQEVGIYGAPYRMLEVLINISYLFMGLILPILATAVAIKNFNKLKIVVQSTFDFLIIMTIPMIVGGYFLSRQLMVLMAGPDFIISGDILRILLLATGAIFIAGSFGYVVVALDKQKQMIKFYAINAILSITGYLIFIPKYGYWGAAWMTVFTEVFILITASYVMYKNIHFFPNFKLLGKSIVASFVMAIPLYFFSSLGFVLSLGLGILVYFFTLYLLKAFDKQTVLEIVKIRKNETTNNQS